MKIRKNLCILLAIVIIVSLSNFSVSAIANIDNNDNINITDEHIDKYGTITTDEFGNEVIEIPLGWSTDNSIFMPELSIQDDTPILQQFGVVMYPYVVSRTVTNVSSVSYNNVIPVTSYADQGFTISKTYNETFTINASLSLNGGISSATASAQLGATIGGSYSKGSGESYSAKVPSGYRGRIAYRYDSKIYYFTNAVKWSTGKMKYYACSGESKPSSGYYYLQLVVR